MKNKQEQSKTYNSFCNKQTACITCPLGKSRDCFSAWLELERKTSKSMINDLAVNFSGIIIGEDEANKVRIEMLTKLLSHRNEIIEIWKAQDEEAWQAQKEASDDKDK